MPDVIDTVLLLALPASGKSEVRRYLSLQSEEECKRTFHLGSTVQLDDFPYVHLMRRTDQVLAQAGFPTLFFNAPERSFAEPRDWGTLIELLNEDYADVRAGRSRPVSGLARSWFQRIDHAREAVGAKPAFQPLEDRARHLVEAAMEGELLPLAQDWNNNLPNSLTGKTVVIEFARGGAEGSAMPLRAPFGYAYSIGRLSDEVLERATVLYVWVTAEQSRAKNMARTDPNDPGSILHHGVPEYVMRNDYGCDDMAHLLTDSDRPDTIKIQRGGKTFYLPTTRLDNRADLTTFARAEPQAWDPSQATALRSALQAAFGRLWTLRG